MEALPNLTEVIAATIAALATFIFGFLAQQAQRRNAEQTDARPEGQLIAERPATG